MACIKIRQCTKMYTNGGFLAVLTYERVTKGDLKKGCVTGCHFCICYMFHWFRGKVTFLVTFENTSLSLSLSFFLSFLSFFLSIYIYIYI